LPCRPGLKLIEKLQQAISAVGPAVVDDFSVSGLACMTGCCRPCTVVYHASRKATYMFGDIDRDENIADLVALAEQYATVDDGWCSSILRANGHLDKALARTPAAIIATHADESLIQ